ncbi:MAG: Smr/MutS family protein [Rhodobacteraceae bacterium]|nr:Smr/MutS family protein [Paracoccaceae bacterium]
MAGSQKPDTQTRKDQRHRGRQLRADEITEWFDLVGRRDALGQGDRSERRFDRSVSAGDNPAASRGRTHPRLSQRQLQEQEVKDWESFLGSDQLCAQSDQPSSTVRRRGTASVSGNRAQSGRSSLGALDAKMLRRIHGGKIKPERKIDLHGLTADAAKQALNQFFSSAVADEKRLLLVITGKGLRSGAASGQGILKQMVPKWIEDGFYRNMILYYCPAHQKHGGAGAYYVLLRRLRRQRG